MYTQCPECSVAFRVTAEVLRQAAGKVRCGGCGIAFNALEHLSENKPQELATAEPESQVAEVPPEAPGELEADTPPQSVSAEQSAALLKTLDQLAGSDIRIEDTGVEWRVLNDDEEDEFAPDTKGADGIEAESTQAAESIGDTGTLKFIIEDEDDAPADEVVEEMRFDDNTPLPDDFDFSSEPSPAPEPAVEAADAAPHPEDAQVDLALAEPDEWQDLLGDLDESVVAKALEVDEEVVEPLVHEAIADEPIAEEPVANEPVADEPIAAHAEAVEETRSEPLDMDTQFAIQAEAMGIDLSGMHPAADVEEVQKELQDDELEALQEEIDEEIEEEIEEEQQFETGDTSIEEDLIAAAFETEAAVKALAEIEQESAEEPEDDEEIAEEFELELDDQIEPDDEVEPEDDIEDIALAFDDKVEEAIETIAASFDDGGTAAELSAERLEAAETAQDEELKPEDASDEHVIPEMSEEEKTINMMIDQELFNVAVEDEEGFASTIVQLQPNKAVEGEIDDLTEKLKKKLKDDKPPLVETIIMEGDFVRRALEGEEMPANDPVDSRRYDDPGVSIPLSQTISGAIRGGRRSGDPPSKGVIAAIVALVLLLIAQVVHQTREVLATVPAFNQTIGPVYRMIGKPLTPTWNISGWRFEATKGSTNDNDELLTIYSRIGNNSDKALPYPLVHLSLTDRFEDIIGSRVLEPNEYLAENADPRKLVPPGNTFNAVISIDSPAEAATGFKLNVCYRLTGGQLRCAIEDFK